MARSMAGTLFFVAALLASAAAASPPPAARPPPAAKPTPSYCSTTFTLVTVSAEAVIKFDVRRGEGKGLATRGREGGGCGSHGRDGPRGPWHREEGRARCRKLAKPVVLGADRIIDPLLMCLARRRAGGAYRGFRVLVLDPVLYPWRGRGSGEGARGAAAVGALDGGQGETPNTRLAQPGCAGSAAAHALSSLHVADAQAARLRKRERQEQQRPL